jgi:hypothetical protein
MYKIITAKALSVANGVISAILSNKNGFISINDDEGIEIEGLIHFDYYPREKAEYEGSRIIFPTVEPYVEIRKIEDSESGELFYDFDNEKISAYVEENLDYDDLISDARILEEADRDDFEDVDFRRSNDDFSVDYVDDEI